MAARTYRRILCPIDFSPPSRAALKEAARVARDGGSDLAVLHVVTVPVPAGAYEYFPLFDYERMAERYRVQALRRLEKLVNPLRKGGRRVRILLREGYPDEAIVRAARGLRADLIVMGTHGRRGISRALLGSVASRVLLAAPCPVLAVRKASRG